MFGPLRNLAFEIARLPWPAKLLLAAACAAGFVAITADMDPQSGGPSVTNTIQKVPKPRLAADDGKINTERGPQGAVEPPRPPEGSAVEAPLPSGSFVIEEPEVRPDGSLQYGARSLRFKEIKPVNRDKLCTRASGEQWACGLQAYATLHNAIAKKAIECREWPSAGTEAKVTCRFGATNVVAILVRQGLAELENGVADPDLRDAQARAQAGALGIWDRDAEITR